MCFGCRPKTNTSQSSNLCVEVCLFDDVWVRTACISLLFCVNISSLVRVYDRFCFKTFNLQKQKIVTISPLEFTCFVYFRDKARFNLNVAHEKLSKVKAVDAHLQIKFPLYLVFNSYETATGVVPTSVDNTSTTFNFKVCSLFELLKGRKGKERNGKEWRGKERRGKERKWMGDQREVEW